MMVSLMSSSVQYESDTLMHIIPLPFCSLNIHMSRQRGKAHRLGGGFFPLTGAAVCLTFASFAVGFNLIISHGTWQKRKAPHN